MSLPVVFAFALLQAMAAAPAAPSTQSQPAAPVAAPAAAAAQDASADVAPADPMVCRRIDQAGSPFSVKQCHRLSVWNRIARENN